VSTPVLHPTTVRDEQFAGLTYHIEGDLVPVLHIELGRLGVYFEHHVLLWKHPRVTIEIKPLAGMFKRMLAGMPVFMTQALGPGHIAYSRDGAGQVIPLHLHPGQAIEVREHQFLAATESVEFTFQRVKGVANMLLGGTGFFIDTFTARAEGIVWLHAYGNCFEIQLAAGEQIDIEPGGWVYKDRTVRMETEFQRFSTGLLASAGQLVWNRFTGPGRVGVQSMYMQFAATE
jgi:uncharacterized protein (AIM24 family)